MPTPAKLKIAILGSGNIGTDLLIKSLRSPHLECTLFIGRNFTSPGIVKASGLGIRVVTSCLTAPRRLMPGDIGRYCKVWERS
jgi:acetaldehyde dehydrogenase (acetylating)